MRELWQSLDGHRLAGVATCAAQRQFVVERAEVSFRRIVDWKAGKRVLIRCQAGINRSSLVAALLLIRDGYSARRAIDQLRRTRGGAVLANQHFNDWLLQVDVRRWRG